MSKKTYAIELFYAWQETEDGTFHGFKATDLMGNTSPESVKEVSETLHNVLADLLCTTPDDKAFQCKHMPIQLPDAVVERIKHDAICEYLSKPTG